MFSSTHSAQLLMSCTLFLYKSLYFYEKFMIRECFRSFCRSIRDTIKNMQASMPFSFFILWHKTNAMAKENALCRCNHQRRRRTAMTLRTASLCSLLLVLLACPIVRPMTEEHRLLERKRRGWEWPPKHFVPDTEGWRKLMERRFEQVSRIEDPTTRYNGWVQTSNMALVAPNFTDAGWGLTRAPPDLVQELVDALHAGLPTARPEADIDVIFDSPETRPLFVRNVALNRKVLETLKPMHEEWAGVPLTGALAYGLRAYRNSSSLLMHVDKSLTHIISCILHIDHSEDSEPWPIVIEDFQGNTNEVVLKSGDMLFYESSKCIHGRPRNFTGSWYSSIFVHYYPTGWNTQSRDLEGHYAVPPHWHEQSPPDPDLDEVVVVGTGFHEPNCDHSWCALKDSVKWHGPAKEGVVITTGYDPDDPTTWRTDGAWKGGKDGNEEKDEKVDGSEL